MSDRPPIERIARARAVADAPVGALLANADELARRWLIALIAARPLEQIAELPLDALAAAAPALCEQLVRALASDAELERLLDGADSSTRERTHAGAAAQALALGARDASSLAASVEALRSVVWGQALAELREPPVALVAELAERLAFLCATLLATALSASGDERAVTPAIARSVYRAATRTPDGRSQPTGRRGGAVLIDELGGDELRPLANAATADRAAARAPARVQPASGPDRVAEPAGSKRGAPPPPVARDARGARPWDIPLHDESSAASDSRVADEAIDERRAAPGDEPTVRIRRTSDVRVDELR
jgi:hypothetical protein